jgi:type I restriction enzyme S subunit
VKFANPETLRKAEWFFGSIPDHWHAVPVKHLCIRPSLYGANISAEEYTAEGARFIRTTDIREDGRLNDGGVFLPPDLVQDYLLAEGDFLISRSGTIGRAYVHRAKNGICAYAGYLVRFILRDIETSRFLFYITKSPYFEQWLATSAIEATIGNVNGEKYANMLVPVPPNEEQVAIANFLDRETARLDELMASKERLLNLLSEKRRVLIARIVTRGLNPDAPLRESSISWLGQIPAHWEIERAKWLFYERDERSESGEEELLTVSHLTGVTPRSEKDVNMFEAETTEGYKLCYPGDLVVNTLWAWMGAMGVSSVHGIVSPAYNVYTPTERLDPAYVDVLVRIPVFAEEATRFSKGVWSSRLRLYPEGLFEIWMPVPPLKEQRAIVSYISTETVKLEALREAAERTIGLLRERRAALIAAAVTGKIKSLS